MLTETRPDGTWWVKWTIVNKVDKKERKDHREESKMAGGRKLEEE